MRHQLDHGACVLFILLQASVCLVYGDVMIQDTKETSKQVIESFHVQTDIRYRFATTKMSSIVRNTAGISHEMAFGVTLPKGAFIVSFAMTIDGKVYDGEVKEKKAAKEQYHKAVEQGQSAGHIRQTPRHSNRFDMSVNVANGTAVNFTLIYQQILSRRLGLYEYEMHVEPGQAVEDFNVEVFIQENRPLLFVKTPKIRKASTEDNTVVADIDLTTVDRPSETTAHIRYSPTVQQQGKGGLAARFIVQYDIEHSNKGDVLVADGFFIHLYTPKPRSPLPKDIIFVLDVSGSMGGTKISQLIDAMNAILVDLTEEDRFNILTFSGAVSKWKRTLTPVTSQIIEEAQMFVNKMNAIGGTNINEALLTALRELQGREVQSRAGMIFFLTDGEATSGQTDPDIIARNVKSENVDQTSIYSLAFGHGANFASLKTISTGNNGYARKIYEASDAALQVETLYDEISTVAMKNVTVKYLPSVTKTTETVFPVVHNGTEIMIGGCIDTLIYDRGVVFHAEMSGIEKEGEVDIILEIDDIEEITIDPDDSLNSFFTMPRDYSGIVEKMWAFLTIRQMLTEKQGVIGDEAKFNDLERRILEMSLKYKFVTPLTSMVVTKPDTDSPVESGLEDADNSVSPLRRTQSITQLMSKGSFKPVDRSALRPVGAWPGISFDVGNGPGVAYSPQYSMPKSQPQTRDPNILLIAGNSRRNKKGGSGGSGGSGRRGRTQRRRKSKSKKNAVASVGILRSLVFRTDQTSLCLQPKRIPSGKYLLARVDKAQNSSNGFKVELVTSCLRNCRIIVPESLDLTSSGKTIRVNLSSLSSWEYKQHSDFDVTFVKMNEMVLEHDSVTVSLVRTKKGRKMSFSIQLRLKITPASGSSAMTGVMFNFKVGKKQKQRKTPKFCLAAKTDVSSNLMKRKAIKYKV